MILVRPNIHFQGWRADASAVPLQAAPGCNFIAGANIIVPGPLEDSQGPQLAQLLVTVPLLCALLERLLLSQGGTEDVLELQAEAARVALQAGYRIDPRSSRRQLLDWRGQPLPFWREHVDLCQPVTPEEPVFVEPTPP